MKPQRLIVRTTLLLNWVCELYADDDAFAAHRGSDAMAAATPALGELIAEFVGEPVSAKGVSA
jgi:quinol monooxygenase YgiN